MKKSTCMTSATLAALVVALCVPAQAAANPAAMKDLQRALECQPMKNLTASLKAAGYAADGKLFDAPKGMTVYGLPVAKVGFNPEAGQGEAISTAVLATGVSFEQMKKAAALKLDKTAIGPKVHSRFTKVGLLSHTQSSAGELKLECSPDFES